MSVEFQVIVNNLHDCSPTYLALHASYGFIYGLSMEINKKWRIDIGQKVQTLFFETRIKKIVYIPDICQILH